MKKISLNASIDQKSINYSRVTVLKIEQELYRVWGKDCGTSVRPFLLA